MRPGPCAPYQWQQVCGPSCARSIPRPLPAKNRGPGRRDGGPTQLQVLFSRLITYCCYLFGRQLRDRRRDRELDAPIRYLKGHRTRAGVHGSRSQELLPALSRGCCGQSTWTFFHCFSRSPKRAGWEVELWEWNQNPRGMPPSELGGLVRYPTAPAPQSFLYFLWDLTSFILKMA